MQCFWTHFSDANISSYQPTINSFTVILLTYKIAQIISISFSAACWRNLRRMGGYLEHVVLVKLSINRLALNK